MHRTKYSLPFLYLCLSLIACAKEDTYTDNHRAEIRYECEQTIACRGGRGDLLSSEPVEKCVDESTDHIDDYSSHERDVWFERFERCAPFQGCVYYDCAKSDETYSKAHFAQLQYDCMARVACSNMRGQMMPATAVDACISQNGVMFDIGTMEMRAAFEMRFARCNTMQMCAYVDCK